jgi:DNA polymerase I-like protein with 3'-5' exonuclease and polymerase domains
MNYDIITKQKDAIALVKDLMRCKSVPYDSESTSYQEDKKRSSWKNTKMVMMQFNTGKGIYLVDRRTLTDIQIFKPFFESPDIEKIIHNAQHDGCVLRHEFGITLNGIYDTMVNEGIMLGAVLDETIRKDLLVKLKPEFSAALEHCLKRRGLPDKLEFQEFFWFEPMVKVERKFGRGKTAKFEVYNMPLDVYDKSLGKIVDQYEGTELYKWTNSQCDYSAVDVAYLTDIKEDQVYKINQLNLQNVSNLENKVSRVFIKMSTNGWGFDIKKHTKISAEHEKEYNSILKKLDELVKKENNITGINWGSSAQFCKYFREKFEDNELNKIDDIRNYFKNGKYKDDAALALFMEAQERSHMVKTFGMAYLKYVIDGKVYTTYRQLVNTGRCASKDPNLQQTPTKITRYKQDGKREFIKTEHRKCFVPSFYKDGIFGIADFSGQELAIIAMGSGEEVWLEALRAGKDLHLICAELLFGKAVVHRSEKDKKFYRGLAKTLNFTIAYGGGVSVIAERAMVSEDVARDALYRFKRTFKKVMKWLNDNGLFSADNHVSYTFEPFSRMRKLVFEPEEWRRINIGKNNPVQGSGADMTKLAMIYMDEALENFPAVMIQQQHDELINETATKNGNKLKKLMEECMSEACTVILGEPLSQPEVRLAYNWYKD